LVIDVIDQVHWLRSSYAGLRQRMVDARIEAREYTRERGEDIPSVRDWVWPDAGDAAEPAQVDAALFTGGDNE
ncbi:MAG: xylulose 5-phosphate/fructose 6-phosphate phosphoketolase, partial [Actinobacteria bacterium]|nr:xylulose 5-phosphate/fructose 6-phosphate phosphoketolase [Actinomycetota bacterium]